MTKEQILEGNKLIAEFMGQMVLPIKEGDLYPVIRGELGLKQTRYHSSYDWIMPVFDKLRKVAFDIWDSDTSLTSPKLKLYIDIWYNEVYWIDEETGLHDLPIVYNDESGTLIENIFLAIIDFIQFYNQVKK